jgi:hypothetical protein
MIAAPSWSSHSALDFRPLDRADVARSRPAVRPGQRGPPADPHFIHGSGEARPARRLAGREHATHFVRPIPFLPLLPQWPSSSSQPPPLPFPRASSAAVGRPGSSTHTLPSTMLARPAPRPISLALRLEGLLIIGFLRRGASQSRPCGGAHMEAAGRCGDLRAELRRLRTLSISCFSGSRSGSSTQGSAFRSPPPIPSCVDLVCAHR